MEKMTKTCDCILPVDNQSLYAIYDKISKIPKHIKKAATSLVDNGASERQIYGNSKNEAYTTMNNIVANLLLNLTR